MNSISTDSNNIYTISKSTSIINIIPISNIIRNLICNRENISKTSRYLIQLEITPILIWIVLSEVILIDISLRQIKKNKQKKQRLHVL